MKKSKESPDARRLEQWIEVRWVNGKFVSTFYPPTLEFTKLLNEMNPAPHLIYRRINFVDGVPANYEWTQPDAACRERGGFFIHRMLARDWHVVFKKEALSKFSRVFPSPNPQPRPESCGPCPCDRCSTDADFYQDGDLIL